LIVLLPVIDAPDVYYSRVTGIDWSVIFLMLGALLTGWMMFAGVAAGLLTGLWMILTLAARRR